MLHAIALRSCSKQDDSALYLLPYPMFPAAPHMNSYPHHIQSTLYLAPRVAAMTILSNWSPRISLTSAASARVKSVNNTTCIAATFA